MKTARKILQETYKTTNEMWDAYEKFIDKNGKSAKTEETLNRLNRIKDLWFLIDDLEKKVTKALELAKSEVMVKGRIPLELTEKQSGLIKDLVNKIDNWGKR